MNVVDRTGTFGEPWTWPKGNRPIVGGVLHHTATQFLPTPRIGASWHFCVDKDGTIYEDVPLAACAHHVLNCDKWRPAWVVRAKGRATVSDVNYCAVGIEVVYAPQLGDRPTDLQYLAVSWLLRDLERRVGPLCWVDHRDVQADKIDPQHFDHARVGLGANDGVNGRSLVVPPPPEPPLPPEELAMLTEEQRNRVAAAAWGYYGVAFNPEAAICKAWRDDWVAGEYRGKPETTESVPDEDGLVWQLFGQALAVYVPGQGVTWTG